jgi:hypothetical protein
MPDLGKNGGKMPDLAFSWAKLYYKNEIKIDRAGIAIFANYEVPDLALIGPEKPNPSYSNHLRQTIDSLAELLPSSTPTEGIMKPSAVYFTFYSISLLLVLLFPGGCHSQPEMVPCPSPDGKTIAVEYKS